MGCKNSTTQELTICVVGATGQQGQAVIDALLSSKKFQIRGVTRQPDSAVAQELEKKGVLICKADLDDQASLETAFQGCYGVFCLTNFWEHKSGEKEKQQAKNLAQACKAVSVKHTVWSTLDNTAEVMKDEEKLENGLFHVPHLDSKYQANEYFKEVPTTYLYTSFYYSNFIHFGMGPTKIGDGDYQITFNMEDKPLAMVDVADIGKAVAAIFSKPALKDKSVYIASDILTGQQIADAFSKHKKEVVKYNSVDDETYAGICGKELTQMFKFKRLNNEEFNGLRDLKECQKLTNITSFDQWLSQNGHMIPLTEKS